MQCLIVNDVFKNLKKHFVGVHGPLLLPRKEYHIEVTLIGNNIKRIELPAGGGLFENCH